MFGKAQLLWEIEHLEIYLCSKTNNKMAETQKSKLSNTLTS